MLEHLKRPLELGPGSSNVGGSSQIT